MNHLKKIALFFLFVFTLYSTLPVYAAKQSNTINALLNQSNINVDNKQLVKAGDSFSLSNGEKMPFSILYKGSTYVSARKCGEILGYEIQWDAPSSTIKIKKDTDAKANDVRIEDFNNMKSDLVLSINVVFNSINVSVDNIPIINAAENYTLPNGSIIPCSFIYKNTTYISIRKLIEILDYEIKWDASTNTINIMSKKENKNQNSETPVQNSEIPVQNSETPVQNSETPVEAAKVKNVVPINDTTIEVEFTQPISKTSGENFENYVFYPKLKIAAVTLDSKGTKATITTSDKQGMGMIYSITINNIIDAKGNMVEKCEQKFGGLGSRYTSIKAITDTTLELKFKNPVEKISAENIKNYKICMENNKLYEIPVINAVLTSDNKTVIITMDSKDAVTAIYELLIDNIEQEGKAISESIPFGHFKRDAEGNIIQFPIFNIYAIKNKVVTIALNKGFDKSLIPILQDSSNYSVYSVDDNTKITIKEFWYGTSTRIVTSEMEVGKEYRLEIKGILENGKTFMYQFPVTEK
jgi:hypothetical protein